MPLSIYAATHAGGLRDTVIDFNPEEQSGTGWTFGNCDASGLMHATGLALHTLGEYPKDFEVSWQIVGMKRMKWGPLLLLSLGVLFVGKKWLLFSYPAV